MEKNKLLLFPFFLGLTLLVYSWFLSYPLSINSTGDYVFNHVSVLYWFSLPLILASMYALAITSKKTSVKWIITLGLVMAMYSMSYFYRTPPTSDAHYFRGLTEYFVTTETLESPLKAYHTYFEWPSFFLLSDITTSLTGFELIHFEFLLYTIIGFLLATSLYIYACKAHKRSGFFAVVGFVITMFYFLNYQAVPCSLSFSLLFLLFALETHTAESYEKILTTLVLFASITFIHMYVPLFYILYQLIQYAIQRDKKYIRLFLLTVIVYFAVQAFQAPLSFTENIKLLMHGSPQYANIAERTLEPASVPLDVIAQMFSRFVVIVTGVVCAIGFIVFWIKRGIGPIDKAILLTGAVWSAFGALIFILGQRTFPVIFLPISLGASYLIESRFKSYSKHLFLVLLILFVFIPIHQSFYDSQIFFQTEEAYQAENFMVNHYNWTNPSHVLAHVRVKTYLNTKPHGNAYLESEKSLPFPRPKEYDSIVYTIGLGKNLLKHNCTLERIFRGEKFNLIYCTGISKLAVRSSNFTWTRAR